MHEFVHFISSGAGFFVLYLDEALMRVWLRRQRRRCRRRFDEAGDQRRPGMKQSLRSTWTRRCCGT